MDGTLTVPVLDFKKIRRELDIPENSGDLVDVIKTRNPADQLFAWNLIERHEAEAAANCRLQPGVIPVLKQLEKDGFKLGIVTRNSEKSANIVLRRLDVAFSPVLTREFPFMKPSPEPVLHVLESWQFHPTEVMTVGDYIHDIISGREAGAVTCYFRNPQGEDFSEDADLTVNTYHELYEHLSKSF